jgi:translation elongation factor P/translation initiation factor 5A
MNSDKKQIQVKELKEGDYVVSLNGDRWKITSMKKCNRAGAVGDAIDNDGQFYKMTTVGPDGKTMEKIWHSEQKVMAPA